MNIGTESLWRSMDCAPKDGTMLQLLVLPSTAPEDGWTPFADSSDPYVTIGFNAFADTGEDQWQFAGWDWCHDCFTDGAGEVIGWLPCASASVLADDDEVLDPSRKGRLEAQHHRDDPINLQGSGPAPIVLREG